MDQVVPESPGRIVTLQRQKRDASSSPFFFFFLFKIPLSNPRLESQAMWPVCILRFKCSTMPTMSAETCRSSWTDKTT